MSANYRRHERYGGSLTVQVAGDGTRRFGTIYEISAGGAFLEVSPLPSVGVEISVTVTRAGGERLTLPAVVRYYASGLQGPRGLEGVGIEWLELQPDEKALVDEMIARAQEGRSLRGSTESDGSD
jgi:hypothetical protein